MSRSTHVSHSSESVRWGLILAITALLGLIFCSVLNGERPPKPRLLPAQILLDAMPMELDQGLIGSVTIREAMELGESGQFEQAIAAWSNVALDEDALQWRHVARAHYFLKLKQLEHAYDELALGMRLNEDNPLFYALRAKAFLMQARTAPRHFEMPDKTGTVFVSHGPVVPATREMLRFAARQDLRRALAHAHLDLEAFVVADSLSADCGVMVGELLYSLELENWVAKTHLTLGQLYIVHGPLDSAERHLDQAKELGEPCPKSYIALADQYELDGRWRDAIRSHAKSATAGGSLLSAATNILETIGVK